MIRWNSIICDICPNYLHPSMSWYLDNVLPRKRYVTWDLVDPSWCVSNFCQREYRSLAILGDEVASYKVDKFIRIDQTSSHPSENLQFACLDFLALLNDSLLQLESFFGGHFPGISRVDKVVDASGCVLTSESFSQLCKSRLWGLRGVGRCVGYGCSMSTQLVCLIVQFAIGLTPPPGKVIQ